jgi:hypothetical protein
VGRTFSYLPVLLLPSYRAEIRHPQKGAAMLYGRGPDEIALASSAILLQLIQQLVDRKLLPRRQMLALLGDAADELVRDRKQTTAVHILAADIIRKELVPKV